MEHYVLDDDHQPRAVGWDEYVEWSRGGFDETKRVAQDDVNGANVSTVFLGLDHSYDGPPPVLFETMVFHLPNGGEPCWRYTTWDYAVAGHNAVVQAIRDGADLDALDLDR